MRKILLLLGLIAPQAFGIPLATVTNYCSANIDECRRGTVVLNAAEGTTDQKQYMLQVDPTTGAIPVSNADIASSTTFSGQQASTGTATALPTQTVKLGVWVQNPPGSGQTVQVISADSGTTGLILSDGMTLFFIVSNLNKIKIQSGSGTVTVGYYGS